MAFDLALFRFHVFRRNSLRLFKPDAFLPQASHTQHAYRSHREEITTDLF
jgi:hypothetical protein